MKLREKYLGCSLSRLLGRLRPFGLARLISPLLSRMLESPSEGQAKNQVLIPFSKFRPVVVRGENISSFMMQKSREKIQKESFLSKIQHFSEREKSSFLLRQHYKEASSQFFEKHSASATFSKKESCLPLVKLPAPQPGMSSQKSLKIFTEKYKSLSSALSFTEKTGSYAKEVLRNRFILEKGIFRDKFILEKGFFSKELGLSQEKRFSLQQDKVFSLRENFREHLKTLHSQPKQPPPLGGGRTINISNLNIEGANIRDFDSFRRELSFAVEEL